MTRSSPLDDWARFDPAAIPTKSDLAPLEAWLDRVAVRGARVLDLGCGVGGVSARLVERGLDVVGVDVNEAALERARLTTKARFVRGDVAGDLAGLGRFDLVVCQLVLSVVGDPPARRRLLANARDALVSGGRVFLSASGVSADINPAYTRLYAADLPLTGERHTYHSRDADGRVLYTTHHFEAGELADLLAEAGFAEVRVTPRREASSRRPEEAAWFLYAEGRRP